MATQEARAAAPARISFEEFLAAYDGTHAEWVDGEVFVMSPGNERQSDLTGWLAALVRYWSDAHGLGKTYVPTYSVRLRDRAALEPDVFFVRREHLDRVRGTFVDGPADLVVEVISPSTRGRDRGETYYEYEQAGVPEYWMIDPIRKKVETYRLAADGTYQLVDLGSPGVLRSEVLPGLEIPVAWLWEEPLPALPRVFRDWGLGS